MNCHRRERSGSSSIKIIVESAVETDEPDTGTSGCVAAVQRLATGRQGVLRAFHVLENSAIAIARSATVKAVSVGGPRSTPVCSASVMADPAWVQRTTSASAGIATTAIDTTRTNVRTVFMSPTIHDAAVSVSGHQCRGRHIMTDGAVAQYLPFPPAGTIGQEIAGTRRSANTNIYPHVRRDHEGAVAEPAQDNRTDGPM